MSKTLITKATARYADVRLTLGQAAALESVVGAANCDGDHRDWLKSSGATASEMRALSDIMRLTRELKGWRRAIQ